MPGHKNKTKSNVWSTPEWSDQYQRWYCQRVGRHEYYWYEDNNEAAPRIPPSGDSIEQLTAGVGNLGVHGNANAHSQAPPANTVDRRGSVTDTGTSDLSSSPHYTHDTSHHAQAQPGLDKGKGPAAKQPTPYDYTTTSGHPSQQTGTSSAVMPDAYGIYQEQPGASYHPAATYPSTSSSYYALRRSKQDTYGHGGSSGTSSSTASQYNTGNSAWAAPVNPGAYGPSADPGEGGELTPHGSPTLAPAALPLDIRGTPGREEALDPRFKLEPSYRFQPGEVFKVLWSEPRGASATVPGDISDVGGVDTQDGQFYVGYRRFIIVGTDPSHHSTCVPILTYDRRGCGKPGVRPSKHGIIHSMKHRPRSLRGEPDLGFPPVVRLRGRGMRKRRIISTGQQHKGNWRE
ncbi:hypothetical protein F4780DRAFT_250761 [Xylariomycetidae sp. FL0641]|nr:hypothetical protein F4780DRAFT_250761 [Xylariomycetidae sp. FL0641]